MHPCLAIAALLLMAAAPAPTRLQARAAAGRTLTLLAARGKRAWAVTVAQTGQRITASAEADALPDAPPMLMPLAKPGVDDLLLPVLAGRQLVELFEIDMPLDQSGRITDCKPSSVDGKPLTVPPDRALIARLCHTGSEPTPHE